MQHFLLNDTEIAAAFPPGRPVRDFLRVERRLTATKPACRKGDCGACQVLLGCWDGENVSYRSVNSCLLPLGEAVGRHVVTVEGLNHEQLSPIQRVLVEEGGIQCGYCTPGLVIAMTGYLLEAEDPKLRCRR